MNRNFALFLVGLAGVCWASSGIAAQDFFAHSEKTPLELSNIRMFLSGIIMTAIIFLRGKFLPSFSRLNRKKILWLYLIIYGILGVIMVQFTYFQAISIGGAAATTVILSATPAMVVIWESVYNKKFPRRVEILAVILAVTGVFLLVTGGNPTKLLVPISCVFWSLLSGAVFAFSMIFGKYLIDEKIDPSFMICVGMLIGGLINFAVVRDFNWSPFFAPETIFDVAWIIIFGTITAFWIFNLGLKFLTPEESAITATTEPASSVVMSYFVFGTAFGLIESIGIILVLLAIFCAGLSRVKKSALTKKDNCSIFHLK